MAEGTLLVKVPLQQPGAVREERLPFANLQELLDLCVSHTEGAAFVQVQVAGISEGRRRRLVLDFGHFGAE
ncbi:MAG: hypothetical protein ABR567_22105 [Myxococcales bacterium]|nr:hypothetical protein [Myxococcales bacterium]